MQVGVSGHSFMFRVDETSVDEIGVDKTAVDKRNNKAGIVLENSIHKNVK